MRNLTLTVAFALSLIALPASSAAPAPPAPGVAQPDTGVAELKARPWAMVSVNGVHLGTTPRTVTLTAGQHRATFKRHDVTLVKTFDVAVGKTTQLMVDMTNGTAPSLPDPPPKPAPDAKTIMIQFQATPWAMVTVDGKSVGTTPVRLELPVGSHEVVFNKGAKQVKRTFEVAPDAPTTVKAAL